MRKTLILLAALLLSVSNIATANYREPSLSMTRGVELFEAGRWSDARHQFLKIREMLPSTAVGELQSVDYYITMCAIKSGDAEAEKLMLDFMTECSKIMTPTLMGTMTPVNFPNFISLSSKIQKFLSKTSFTK